MSSCKLVVVEWVDSAQPSSNWQFLNSVDDFEAVKCVSVGWMIHDGGETKALAQNFGDLLDENNAQVSGIIRIPTRCILSIHELDQPNVTFSSPCVRPETEQMPLAS